MWNKKIRGGQKASALVVDVTIFYIDVSKKSQEHQQLVEYGMRQQASIDTINQSENSSCAMPEGSTIHTQLATSSLKLKLSYRPLASPYRALLPLRQPTYCPNTSPTPLATAPANSENNIPVSTPSPSASAHCPAFLSRSFHQLCSCS